VDFEVVAMQLEAAGLSYSGQQIAALRLLHQALSIASERHLQEQMPSLNLDIARCHFLLNDYETARKELEPLVTRDSQVEGHATLGRTYVRLGDFAAGKRELDQALSAIESSGEKEFVPLADVSSARWPMNPEGRTRPWHISRRPKPHRRAVCRTRQALRTLLCGNAPRPDRSHRSRHRAGEKDAPAHSETACRLNLAKVHFERARYAQALASQELARLLKRPVPSCKPMTLLARTGAGRKCDRAL
jgi:tetratricopeptide (TPR) repeat protein